MISNSNSDSSSDATLKAILGDIRHHIDDLALNDAVVAALLPKGIPHNFESQVWDYKQKLPSLSEKPTDSERKEYDAALAELMKDAVAFHNAFGGYIVFGVSDKGGSRVVGCTGHFDCGDFNRRLKSYAEVGASIECFYREFQREQNIRIGILLVPRRASHTRPVRFRKDGPLNLRNGKTFTKETYVRVLDECRPATSTSEDWQFLHSDRSPPDQASITIRPVRGRLPARDPDLVEFVGRQQSLAELRRWVTDPRSPIRLVTGIGGLGKTTLAYRFAEEVIETGAGEIEWVIWLTAKKRTFSALRGRMLDAASVDFTDLAGIYSKILRVLSFELELGPEEPTLDELQDRLVEALQTYSCMIVVDDIDSLSPEAQRETVSALSALAFQTVGRELPPSRILMTSRIDQGLAPTSVVKISGLDQQAFSRLVAHLCGTFHIPPVSVGMLDKLYKATSGSPLFAASVLRLVSLGENLTEVVETWAGQDGEEVREFAFKREIERLTISQAQHLYAILLLGETSINDLAKALDVTPKVSRERVAELQAYHLIATATTDAGDTVLTAPNDLISVSELVKGHLGPNAQRVEQAGANALSRGQADLKSVGLGIRRILGFWETSSFNEAVVVAKQLRERFPKSGDAASILGAALMRTKPPKFEEAHRELEVARALGCGRPELLENLIKAKVELREWASLHDLTRKLSTRQPSRDAPLDAFILATQNLIKAANVRGDALRVSSLAIEVVEKIGGKLSRIELDRGYFERLNSHRLTFARTYIDALGKEHSRAGEKLHVFEGVSRLADIGVILTDLLRVGVGALQEWWRDVEKRPIVDLTACSILSRQLRRLEKIENQYASFSHPASDLLRELGRVRKDLEYRGGILSKQN